MESTQKNHANPIIHPFTHTGTRASREKMSCKRNTHLADNRAILLSIIYKVDRKSLPERERTNEKTKKMQFKHRKHLYGSIAYIFKFNFV